LPESLVIGADAAVCERADRRLCLPDRRPGETRSELASPATRDRLRSDWRRGAAGSPDPDLGGM